MIGFRFTGFCDKLIGEVAPFGRCEVILGKPWLYKYTVILQIFGVV